MGATKRDSHETQSPRSVLGVPTSIWLLQLGYVALALGLFALISLKLHRQVHQLSFQLEYVVVMVAVNIAWRVAIRKAKTEWFQR